MSVEAEALAAIICASYRTYFYAPTVCVVAALLFAVSHHYLYAVALGTSALLYFPVSLSQYRSARQNCEKAIREYERWDQEQRTDQT